MSNLKNGLSPIQALQLAKEVNDRFHTYAKEALDRASSYISVIGVVLSILVLASVTLLSNDLMPRVDDLKNVWKFVIISAWLLATFLVFGGGGIIFGRLQHLHAPIKGESGDDNYSEPNYLRARWYSKVRIKGTYSHKKLFWKNFVISSYGIITFTIALIFILIFFYLIINPFSTNLIFNIIYILVSILIVFCLSSRLIYLLNKKIIIDFKQNKSNVFPIDIRKIDINIDKDYIDFDKEIAIKLFSQMSKYSYEKSIEKYAENTQLIGIRLIQWNKYIKKSLSLFAASITILLFINIFFLSIVFWPNLYLKELFKIEYFYNEEKNEPKIQLKIYHHERFGTKRSPVIVVVPGFYGYPYDFHNSESPLSRIASKFQEEDFNVILYQNVEKQGIDTTSIKEKIESRKLDLKDVINQYVLNNSKMDGSCIGLLSLGVGGSTVLKYANTYPALIKSFFITGSETDSTFFYKDSITDKNWNMFISNLKLKIGKTDLKFDTSHKNLGINVSDRNIKTFTELDKFLSVTINWFKNKMIKK